MIKRKIIAAIAVIISVGGYSASYANPAKDIDLILDGQTYEYTIKADTIDNALNEINYNLKATDELNHDLDKKVKNKDTIEIKTQKDIKFNSKEITTNSVTVKELLEELDYDYKQPHRLNYKLDDKIEDDMKILYAPYIKDTVEIEKEIPYEKEVVYDFNLPYGEKKIEDGEKGLAVEIINYENKDDFTIKDSKTIIKKEPKNRKIIKGSRYEKKEKYSVDVVYENDDSLFKGEEKIKQEAKKGIKIKVYKKTGKRKKLVEEIIKKKAEPKIILVGTKENIEQPNVNTNTNSQQSQSVNHNTSQQSTQNTYNNNYVQQENTQTYQEPVQETYSDTETYQSDSNWAKEWIAQRESNGSYTAYNPNGGYYGRYQLNPSLISYGASPAEQEIAADNYVYQRYGSWENAQAFWANNGWY